MFLLTVLFVFSNAVDADSLNGVALHLLQKKAVVHRKKNVLAQVHKNEPNHSLCDSNRVLSFRHAKVTRNNLGKQGPVFTDPEGIRWEGVLRDDAGHSLVDVIANAPSDAQYIPNNSSHNGKSGHYGKINIKTGSSIKVKFSFVKHATIEPHYLPPTYFSLFDFDEGFSLASREFGSIEPPCVRAITSGADTEVRVVNSTIATTFISSRRGGKNDNPIHPLNLGSIAKHRVATCQLMEHTHEFYLTIGAANFAYPRGTNFLFSGPSGLVCAGKGSCSDFQCPVNTVQRVNSEYKFCRQNPCDAQHDVSYCCRPIHR